MHTYGLLLGIYEYIMEEWYYYSLLFITSPFEYNYSSDLSPWVKSDLTPLLEK